MENNLFADYNLSAEILKTLEQMNFLEPTPIQKRVFDILLKEDRDMVALAQTGTGKTAAFGLPLIEKIKSFHQEGQGKQIYSLIMCPTRELAQQVATQLTKLSSKTSVTVTTISGGASYRQQHQDLQRKPSIVVATPGRLRDWIERGEIDLSGVRYLILDEADEMLSMGFEEDLEYILSETSTESERKTWLFSATMNQEVRKLSKKYLNNEAFVEVAAERGQTADQVELLYFTVKEEDKMEALMRLLQFESTFYGLIFCQTKAETAQLADKLNMRGIPAQALHGDLKQSERERVLKKLKAKQITCVVATDVAARGIDVPELTHVINYHLPRESEVFVHRVGRTGRNGKTGKAWSFVAPYELKLLQQLSRFLKSPLKKSQVPKTQEVLESRLWSHVSEVALTETHSFKEFLETLSKEDREKLEGISVEALWAYLLKEDLEKNEQEDRDLDFVGQGKVPWELSNKSHRGGKSRKNFRNNRGGGHRNRDDRWGRGEQRRDERGSHGEKRFDDRSDRRDRKNFGSKKKKFGDSHKSGGHQHHKHGGGSKRSDNRPRW